MTIRILLCAVLLTLFGCDQPEQIANAQATSAPLQNR